MKSIVLGVVAAGLTGTLAICNLCPVPAEATPRVPMEAARADIGTVMLRVEGMTCGGCTLATRKVLERLDGVKKADVSYEKSLAVLTYHPAKVGVPQMIAAVKTLGYKATAVTAKQ